VGSLVLLFYLNSTEHSKNKTDRQKRKKKEKMASQRPWRSAGFDALRRDYKGDNNDDDDERMPDVKASGSINGARVNFTHATSDAPEKVFRTIADPDLAKSTRDLLDYIRTGLHAKYQANGSPVIGSQQHLRLTDLLSTEKAFLRLKLVYLNFMRIEKADNVPIRNYHGELYRRDVSPFAAQLRQILEGVSRFFNGRVEIPFYEVGTSVSDDERGIAAMAQNVVFLKRIYDLILNTEKQVRNAQVSPPGPHVAEQEPPFYPVLSDDERNLVWAWVKARERALDLLYSDDTYVFAMKVAGHVNMSEVGVDKLITSSHQQRLSRSDFDKMPSAHYDDSQISNERTVLFERYVELLNTLENSKIDDLKQRQLELNAVGEIEDRDGGRPDIRDPNENMQIRKEWMALYRIEDENDPHLPSMHAELAVFGETPSEMTRMLQSNVDSVERAMKGIEVNDSRKRLLWATDWMMRPEVSGHADLSPLFIAAIGAALLRARSFNPKLRPVKTGDSFILSKDLEVVDGFAELVALQIMRIKFFSPTKTLLDKMGARISERERRLLFVFRHFFFDTSLKTVREGGGGYGFESASCESSAMYAF
jgi:hypothetical protein